VPGYDKYRDSVGKGVYRDTVHGLSRGVLVGGITPSGEYTVNPPEVMDYLTWELDLDNVGVRTVDFGEYFNYLNVYAPSGEFFIGHSDVFEASGAGTSGRIFIPSNEYRWIPWFDRSVVLSGVADARVYLEAWK